jgi:hypothetical protein
MGRGIGTAHQRHRRANSEVRPIGSEALTGTAAGLTNGVRMTNLQFIGVLPLLYFHPQNAFTTRR